MLNLATDALCAADMGAAESYAREFGSVAERSAYSRYQLLQAGLALARGDAEADDVIGYLVGIISGVPFDVFLEERILKPLDLNDTGFCVPREQLDRFAALYERTKAAGWTGAGPMSGLIQERG